MKTEVYSWRLTPELKQALEREARRRDVSVSRLIEEVIRRFLRDRRTLDDDAEQGELRAELMRCAGTIRGTDPTRSLRVSELVRQRLRQRHARRS